MDLHNLKNLKIAMQLAGIKANKGLGQHFLVDSEAVASIIAAANIKQHDTVLEIGPGLGVMTDELAKTGAQIVAVETDAKLVELLRRRMPENVQIKEADIMNFELGELAPAYKVVANVPYYITSSIIRLLMEAPNPPAQSVLLIQKEVAQRLVAKPGQLSILALSVQYYADVELVVEVSKDKFWPAPKVDSAVVRIVRKSKPAFEAQTSLLFRLIKAGFGEKRKQMRNSLAGGLHISPVQVDAMLSRAQLSSTVRAQELSLDDWHRLYDIAVADGVL